MSCTFPSCPPFSLFRARNHPSHSPSREFATCHDISLDVLVLSLVLFVVPKWFIHLVQLFLFFFSEIGKSPKVRVKWKSPIPRPSSLSSSALDSSKKVNQWNCSPVSTPSQRQRSVKLLACIKTKPTPKVSSTACLSQRQTNTKGKIYYSRVPRSNQRQR